MRIIIQKNHNKNRGIVNHKCIVISTMTIQPSNLMVFFVVVVILFYFIFLTFHIPHLSRSLCTNTNEK